MESSESMPLSDLDSTGTLAIGKAGAINAALLATAILGNKYPKFRKAYKGFRREQTAKVLADRKPKSA